MDIILCGCCFELWHLRGVHLVESFIVEIGRDPPRTIWYTLRGVRCYFCGGCLTRTLDPKNIITHHGSIHKQQRSEWRYRTIIVVHVVYIGIGVRFNGLIDLLSYRYAILYGCDTILHSINDYYDSNLYEYRECGRG